MNIDKKALFKLALSFIPGKLGDAIVKVEDAVTEKGVNKQDKAIDITDAGLRLGKVLSEDVWKHPKFQKVMRKTNDVLVELGNVAQQIHDEASAGTAVAQGDGAGL